MKSLPLKFFLFALFLLANFNYVQADEVQSVVVSNEKLDSASTNQPSASKLVGPSDYRSQLSQAPDTSTSLAKAFGGLAVIVVMILSLAWVAKRLNQGRHGFASHMRVVGMLPLGSKEKLVMVKVCDEHLLLGVTPAGISKLHDVNISDELDSEVDERKSSLKPISLLSFSRAKKASENNLLAANNASEFSKKLKDFLTSGKQNG